MVEKTKNGAEKKETPLYVKIFIALFAVSRLVTS